MELLEKTLAAIIPPDKSFMTQSKCHWDNLTKPIASLGWLEHTVTQICGIRRELFPKIDNKCIIIMCADNGVTAQGVSSCPKSVTADVTRNFTRGITGVNVFARHAGSAIHVVDIGVDADINISGVVNKKIMRSTHDISAGPAMTRQQAVAAIETGIEAVSELAARNVNLLGTGEMGIGNTTTSAAVCAVYSNSPVDKVVGRGSGLTTRQLSHKINVVNKALDINKPNRDDAIDVLSKVGGLDIGGLTGCFLAAASHGIPILIDGFISGVAAILAHKLNPLSAEYMIASHCSAEPGMKAVEEILKIKAPLLLDMRLGEGSGAALGFTLIDAAMAAYTGMGTFDEAMIKKYESIEE